MKSIQIGSALMINLLIVLGGCSSKHPMPLLKGPYMGQEPPGSNPELFAPDIISTSAHEMSITISKDLKHIDIGRSSLNWSSSIVHFEQGVQGWSGPQLAPFSRRLGDTYPFYAPDNQSLYFNSNRPPRHNAPEAPTRKIWTCHQTDGHWSLPEMVAIDVEASEALTYPSISEQGTIFFNAFFEGGEGGSDLYCVTKTAEGYGKPQNLGPAINTPHHEFHPYIAPDESLLIFDALHPDGEGANDLYISFKQPDGTWAKAVNLGQTVNGPWSDMRPYLSPDGKYLFFVSTRPDHPKGFDPEALDHQDFEKVVNGPGNGSQDIYWVSAAFLDTFRNK